jgi:Ca2+-transporting ATPase
VTSQLGPLTEVRVPTPAGLSTAQAADRLARDGPNALPPARQAHLGQRIVLQLRDPLIMVLLVAAALTTATGDWADTGVILLVILVNTGAGIIQEVKADRAIAALGELAAPQARVVRDGQQRSIPAREVVTGDLLVLGEGEIVPADAAVVESAALLADEAALTGESVPVDKVACQPGQTAALSNRPAAEANGAAAGPDSMVSAGTVVVRGRGLAVVTATGARSAMGQVAALMAAGPVLTPLQRRLAGLGRVLALVAAVLSTAVLVIGLVRGQPAELMVITAISLVVAAVPESLPAVVTLALALGARRMAARHAVVRHLPAVETLGSVTVLATDKTGTLTEGVMTARSLWTVAGDASIIGHGYAPGGGITRAGHLLAARDAPDVAELLMAAALCNDATLRAPSGETPAWTALGDPTEAALLAAARKLGLDTDTFRARFPRRAEVPFDSTRRRMTTVHNLPGGGLRIIVKGAPEVVLRSPLLRDAPDIVACAARRAEQYARDGFRVLAIAQADRAAASQRDMTAPGLEQDLQLIGLVAILDPPRAAAAGTIAECQAAGITPVLITGDHPATARSIATKLGIIDDGQPVIDCHELPDSQTASLGEARVFARATPEQKLRIIQAHRRHGDVVAMTGDGVNDGPALRRADIGVAMGQRGTEVARQAADLVLANDDLGTVVAAAEEGRRVYANIRRFLLYALAGGTAEIIVMLAGPLVGLALPLLPAQILWINLLTHGLPGVALGGEPADPRAMRRPPRPPAESVLGARLWQRILRVGVAIAAVTLSVALWGHATGRPWQSMAFFALGTTQLAVAVASRARPGTWANPMLLVAVGGALLLQFAGLYLPPLQDLLGTEPLTLLDLAVVFALSTIGYGALRLDRILHPSVGRRDQARAQTPWGHHEGGSHHGAVT